MRGRSPAWPGPAGRSAARRYDLVSRLPGIRDAQWQLVAQAGFAPTATVLDIGTGTGTVALLAKRAVPSATTIGLDPDPDRLAYAALKAARAHLELQLDTGSATQLPYPDGSIDRVLSSFMFHHLDAGQQIAAVREVRRVLAPGGSLHLLDLTAGGSQVPWGRLLTLGCSHDGHRGHRHAHHHHPPTTNTTPAREVLALMTAAGLVDAVEVTQGRSAIGRHAFYRAHR